MSAGERVSVSLVLQALAVIALVLLALWGLEGAGVTVQRGPVFGLGFLVVTGAMAGRVASFLRLPRLTGYLIAGILAGPQSFEVLSKTDVKALSLVNALALALIALQAGAELTLPTLQRTWKSVLISSGVQSVVVIIPIALLFFLLRDHMPFLVGTETSAVAAVAVVWGVVSLSRSPAVTLAILGETRAKGPVAEHALGVVVVLDVLVLPLFAVAMALARGQIAGEAFEPGALVHLGYELFASVCAGATFGLLIALLLRLISRERALLIVVLGYGVTALSVYLRYDTLLVFVVAGFVVMNLTRFGHGLVETSQRVSAGVMIVFFATAGAKLDLQALRELWPVAVAFFVARVLVTWVSCQIGHRLAGDPPVVRKLGFTSLISQAGVTIGLATIVADSLPGIGKALATLAIAVVGINELVGPVVFTLGLKRAGEIPGATTAPPAGPPAGPPA